MDLKDIKAEQIQEIEICSYKTVFFWYDGVPYHISAPKSWPTAKLADAAALHVGLAYGDIFRFHTDETGRMQLIAQGTAV